MYTSIKAIFSFWQEKAKNRTTPIIRLCLGLKGSVCHAGNGGLWSGGNCLALWFAERKRAT